MSDIVEDLKRIENIWNTNNPYIFIEQTWEKEEFEKIIQSPLFKTIFPEKEIDVQYQQMRCKEKKKDSEVSLELFLVAEGSAGDAEYNSHCDGHTQAHCV